MSKLLVVFGATGQQGGSIISYVLDDAELLKRYRIRAITRHPSSPEAERLAKKGVDIVKADFGDPESLSLAMTGAHTVFFMTLPAAVGPDPKYEEFAQGKAVLDAAMTKGVQYVIFSTLPQVTRISGGKYTKVAVFEAKAEIEEYIRKLPIRSAFFSPASFMQNFQRIMAPQPSEDGTFILARHVSPDTQLPLIDAVGDTGKYVGAILADPDKYEGKVFCAASKVYTMTEIADIMSKVSAKTVKYKQISEGTFRRYLHAGSYADNLIDMMLFQQEFGYYGPQTKALVAWAVENARGKVHTLEEYLTENPLPALQ